MAPFRAGDLPSEALVTVVGGEPGTELFALPPPSWVTVRAKQTLEECILEESDAVIIKGDKYLSNPALQANSSVPVIYFANKTADSLKLIDRYNLYDVSNHVSMRETLLGALEAHAKVMRYLRESSGGEERIRSLDPPRFRNALKVAESFDDEQTSFLGMLSENAKDYARIHFREIVQLMASYSAEADIRRRRGIGLELGKQIAQLLAHDRFLSRSDVNYIQTLGDGANGEGDVREVASSTELLLGGTELVYKRIEARGALSAKDIALQRANDAKWLEANNPRFKTVKMLTPFAFEDYPEFGRNDAFIVMQKVKNPQPFYKVIEHLSGACAVTGDQRYADLRSRLLFKFIGDCASWINAQPPITSGLERPKDKELVENYRSQIRDVPAVLGERSAVKFGNLEMRLWDDATKILRRISTKKRHVVRNRDAGAGNLLISMPTAEPSAKDYIDCFFTDSGTIDEEKISGSVYNTDMQYRYGHVLEDLAMILSGYEARFLLYDSSDGKSRMLANRARKSLFKIRDDFAEKIGEPSLAEDDASFVLMLLYRTARKLLLFTNYWDLACRKYGDVELTKPQFEERRERYTINIMHHYNLGRVLCQEGLRLFKAKGSPSACRLEMSEESAQLYLQEIRGAGECDKDRLRLAALKAFFDKMAEGFVGARAGKDYCLINPYGEK